jgi:hypothetical protein
MQTARCKFLYYKHLRLAGSDCRLRWLTFLPVLEYGNSSLYNRRNAKPTC